MPRGNLVFARGALIGYPWYGDKIKHQSTS